MPLYDVLIMAQTNPGDPAEMWQEHQVVDVFPAGQLDVASQPRCFRVACAIDHPGTLEDIKAELIQPSETSRNEIKIETSLQTTRYKQGMATQENADPAQRRVADEEWLNFVLSKGDESRSVKDLKNGRR